MSPRDGRCKHCKQRIEWGWTERGHAMPLNPEHGHGDYAVRDLEDGRAVRWLHPWEQPRRGELRMQAHRETCTGVQRRRKIETVETPVFKGQLPWLG